ncbi:unnamed protein product [Sphagnum balticum]
MVNKLHVDSFDLVDSFDDSHWSVEVFAFHCIAAPRNDLIDNVVGISKDQVNQHNLSVKCDEEQGEELHDKLQLVLLDAIVEDDHQDLACCLFVLKHYLELVGMIHVDNEVVAVDDEDIMVANDEEAFCVSSN